MAVLDQLTLSTATSKRDLSPTGRFRRRLLEAIDLQIAMADAEASGTEFHPARQRWIKNEAGAKELREVPLRLRRWWWQDDGGTTYLSVQAGRRALEIAPGKTAIEVGASADLVGKLGVLRNAVRLGELDGCLAAALSTADKTIKKGPAKSPKRAAKRPEDGHRDAAA